MEQTLEQLDPERRMKYMVVGVSLVDDDHQWPNTATFIYKSRKLKELIVVSYLYTAVTVRACELATTLQVADDLKLPYWVETCVLPLFKQLEAFQKTDSTWKAPIVRYTEG
jgi:hypothetical protein